MTSPEPALTWQPLYRIGGTAAMAFVVMVFIPLTLLVAAPVPPTDGRALLEYIATHRIVYLTQLVCFVGLAIPALVVFAAVAVALAGVSKGVAAIGGLFGVGSEVVALAVGSSPQSLHGGLVLLSDAYLAADSGAERLRLAIGQRFYFADQQVTLNEPARSAWTSRALCAGERGWTGCSSESRPSRRPAAAAPRSLSMRRSLASRR